MANGDDDRKSSWSSWLAPGDARNTKPDTQRAEMDEQPKRPTNAPATGESKAPRFERVELEEASTSQPAFRPFIAFKEFVDESFSAITEFPANFAEVMQQRRELQAAKHAEMQWQRDELCRRWTGSNTGCDSHRKVFDNMSPEEVHEVKAAASTLIEESERRNRDVPLEKIKALFAEGVIRSLSLQDPYFVKDEDAMDVCKLGVRDMQGWLSVAWFKHNAYSPINLEADPLLSDYDTKWRHAFEDLLEASLDKPMSSQERFGQRLPSGLVHSTWRGPGLDWMLSLQCRGILPSLPSWYFRQDQNSGPQSILSWANEQRDNPKRLSGRFSGPNGSLEQDYFELCREIATPAAQPKPSSYALQDYQMQLMLLQEQHEKRLAEANRVSHLMEEDDRECARREIARRGGCPDELGRAVADVAKGTEHPVTELELYEQQFALQDDERQEREAWLDFERRAAAWLAKARDDSGEPNFEDFTITDEQLERISKQELRDWVHDLADRGLNHEDEVARLNVWIEDLLRDKGFLQRHKDLLASRLLQEERGSRMIQDAQHEREGRDVPDDFDFESFLAPDSAEEHTKDYWRDRAYDLEDELHESETREMGMLQKIQNLRMEHEKQRHDWAAEESNRSSTRAEAIVQGTSQTGLVERPSVLSTMTTTQTVRLPDGSLQTKVVLKRRFADGREETQESTQTSFDESAAVKSEARVSGEKKGWFWS